jgi:SAM-dependent methyltransferase
MQTELFQLNSEIELHHWWFVARRRILRALVGAVVAPSKDAIIVDVGCGTGGNIGSLSGDYTCVGIDPSSDAVELARKRFPKARFLHGRAPEDLGELAREADLFLLTDVLEHVQDDHALLSRLSASASPGARFLLTVPADPKLWSVHDENHGHYRRYDTNRFQQVWQGLPLWCRLVSFFNCRLYPIVRMVRAINRRRGTVSGDAGSDFRMPSPLMNRVLTRLFSGETKRLVDLCHGRRKSGYKRGVSLVAILERQPGPVPATTRPSHRDRDSHDADGNHPPRPEEFAPGTSSAAIPARPVDPGTDIIHNPMCDA